MGIFGIKFGGDSAGRKRNGYSNSFPARPADAPAKKGKIPKGVQGHSMTGRKKKK